MAALNSGSAAHTEWPMLHRWRETHRRRADAPANGSSPAATRLCRERPATAWSRAISMEALCERLALLFQLEVPCILHFRLTNQSHAWRTPIQRWERRDGRLVLGADRLSLHLCEEQIEALCVIHWSRGGKARKIVELRDKKGALRARILGPHSNEEAAVWQDIMDTFILPLTEIENPQPTASL